ncbi:MAG: rRNA pseudouridine synthase [Verrucomicrobia bacterium]|jgi:23S rRNA pseudouridine2605 synthase|nr:rRNA pseudouridine synthase [Verrucomicrobiota bacterium]
MLKRLNKLLSEAGVSSRRGADELIASGRISINGKVVKTLGIKADPKRDEIFVGNKKIRFGQQNLYYVLNKPKGYLCSLRRLHNERIITDLIPDTIEKRLFTVGRLDKDTEGLILLTSDGDFAHKVIHPSQNLSKEYIAKVAVDITDEHLKTISEGVFIEDCFVKPHKVEKIRRGTLSVVLKDGKKHEVKLLLEKADLPLISLKRVRLGSLLLGDLPTGALRPLSEQEKKDLLKI